MALPLPQGEFTSPEDQSEKGSRSVEDRMGNKAHIGEVQSSLWDDKTMAICEEQGVILL